MNTLTCILFILLLAGIAPQLQKLFGNKTGWVLAIGPILCFAWFLKLLPTISSGTAIEQSIDWFPQLGVALSFYVDGLSLLMALLISGIGSFILIYANGYLQGHPLQGKFYSYLMLFTASMLGIVTADNLIALFVFWELTSISSYLLIGFYHESGESRRKALQALLVTGFGGVALMAGFILLGLASESWSISELLNSDFSASNHTLYPAILTLILLGAFTKSAQWPFHFWLPNAMAAPAPVSAFLHSATMVKAGVFLLARLNPVLSDTLAWTLALTSFGLVTMLVGSINGLLQTDLKKILAYTTLSVLGILVMLLGLGTDLALKSCMVFLVGHALYKATLFMCAGSVDHETGVRDVTIVSGLRFAMPFTALAAGLAAFSKAGFPPFFGFLGKEYVYKTGMYLEDYSHIILGIAIVTNILLMALALKAGIHPFWGKENAKALPKNPHEAPLSMYIGPIILALTGLLFGLFPGSIVTPLISPAVHAVAGHPVEFTLAIWHGFNLPLLFSALTLIGGLVLYALRHRIWKITSTLSLNKWTFDNLYMGLFNGFVSVSKWQTQILQSGSLRRYLLIIFSTSGFLLAYKLSLFDGLPRQLDLFEARLLDWATVLFILGGICMIVKTHSRMTALLSLGLVGFGIAMVFILYGAPDLAITQILVETLIVVLFMLVIYRLPAFRDLSSNKTKFFDGIFAGTVGAIITLLVIKAQNLEIAPTVSGQFGEWSYTLAKGKNVVNVILVDFRALDTLGEITVLAIAGVGVFTLIRGQFTKKRKTK